MNSSKKIDITSKSSLVSLKAELARKHEEVAKAKAHSQAQFIRPIPRPKKETVLTRKNKGVDQREERDATEIQEEEDALKKSRFALETKAKLYDKFSENSSLINDDDDDNCRYLVDFQQKEVTNKPPTENQSVPLPTVVNLDESDEDINALRDSDDYDAPSDPEEDWVDYTDCLGRTRRCLRRDLSLVKGKDYKLSESLGYYEDKTPTPAVLVPDPIIATSDPELLSADMRKELMRQKWEEQEDELKDKPNIHYQDVLFDEARSHGVGYYGFSADEQRRRAQQESLTKLRGETEKQQLSAQTLKARREVQLFARMKAARQRKRQRMGLPPEDEPEPEDPFVVAEEERKAAEEKKATEEKQAVEEKIAADLAKKRQAVRPWDIGKEGVTTKQSEVMSQEEWVKKRRSDRDQEFAPPSLYRDEGRPSHTKKPKHSRSESKPKKIFTPFRNEVGSDTEDEERSSSPHEQMASTSRAQTRDREINVDKPRGLGAEIAPPLTLEYFGPSSVSAGNSRKVSRSLPAELDTSISAGLKFLRHQFEEKQKKQKEKGLLDII